MARQLRLPLLVVISLAAFAPPSFSQPPSGAADNDACAAKGATLVSRIEACTRWHKSAPDKVTQARALAGRGNAYLASGKYAEALVDARAALLANPSESLATWIAAIALKRQGDPTAALGMYAQTIALRPKQAAPRIERAALYRTLGNTEAARADLEEALRLEPTSARALCERAALAHLRRDAAASLKDAARGLEIAPDDAACRTQRAQALLEQGKTADALADARAATQAAPRSAEAHLVLGRIQLRLGDTANAAAALERHFTLLPSRASHVGIVCRSVTDATVIYVSPGSPAADSGIKPNDVLVALDSKRAATAIANAIATMGDDGMAAGTAVTIDARHPQTGLQRHAMKRASQWKTAVAVETPGPVLMGTIGIKVATEDGRPTIKDIARNGPAQRAGLAAGDRILSIDGIAVAGQSLRQVADRIAGPAGSSVVIEVASGAGAPSRRITVQRQADTTAPVLPSTPDTTSDPDPSTL